VISADLITDEAGFLDGGGEMGRRIRAFDWARTPLGSIAHWPASLTTTVGLILRSPVPIVTFWGPAGIMIYNDAYSVFAGSRHPLLLGSEVLQGWPEVAEFNAHVMKAVYTAGGTLSFQDQEMTLHRSGRPEQVFMDLDYSPVIGGDGRPIGVIAIVVETTERHWAQRRSETLSRLSEQIQHLDEPDDVSFAASRLLGELLNVSRVGYGTIDDSYTSFNVSRDWSAPGVDSIAGVIAFDHYVHVLEELRKGEPIVIPDVRSDPRTSDIVPVLSAAKSMALINVPVMERGEVVALLFVNNETPREWSADELAMTQDVANRVRTSVERRRAEAEIRQNERRLRFLDGLNKETARAVEAGQVMAITTRLTGEHLGVAICAYADMEPDQDHFTIRGDWSAPGSASIVGSYSLADFGKLAVRTLRAGEPLIIRDNLRELAPEEAATFQQMGIGATICMPLVKAGQLTALMAVHHKGPHSWTDYELATLAEVVERSWAHIERVRTESEMHEGEQRFREMLESQIEERTAALEQSEAQFRMLVQGVTDYAIYMLDAQGNVSSWNAGAQRIKGYAPEDIIGAHFSRFYTPEDQAAGVPQLALRTAATEGRFEREGWRVRKDGSRFWAHVIIDALRAPDGRLIGFAKITRDITERREAQLALEQSEKNVRSIFETSHLYQALLNAEGTLLYANSTSLDGIKASPQDVLDRPFWDTPWFNTTPGMSEIVRDAVRSVSRGEPVSQSMVLNLPTGVRNFDFTMRPVKNDAGEVVAMVPEAVDTTNRIMTEQALQQAQKMEAIGNLTGGVAHDFNNLLMAVLGSLELLRKRLPDDPTLLRLLDNAVEGAQRGAALTRRMLAFARRQELRSERVDAVGLVGGMTELLQRSLGPMIAVETSFAAELPPIEADTNQLESALLNLAVNARDAMHGEGRIIISAREEALAVADGPLQAGRYVVLAVTDTGEGMDEATLKRATEPFFTTKGVGKGTGLGLSMVLGLAEQSGGTLKLKSTPGEGTSAEIWLPAASRGAEPVASPPPPVQAPAEPAPPRRLRILAVDDDALVLMNTSAMLAEMGHEVTEAYSARDALTAIEARGYDLVITDHAMPQMTGAQLALRVRELRPDLPIVLATGYAELPSGDDPGLPRLSKPFSEADLARAVDNAMRDRLPVAG
jgi:PAS domain S-box-containing protein